MYTITIHVDQREMNELIPYLLTHYGGPVEVGGSMSLEEEEERRIVHYERMTKAIAVGEVDGHHSVYNDHRSGPAYEAFISRRNRRRIEQQRREYPLSLNQACPTCAADIDEPCIQGDHTVSAHPHKARQA